MVKEETLGGDNAQRGLGKALDRAADRHHQVVCVGVLAHFLGRVEREVVAVAVLGGDRLAQNVCAAAVEMAATVGAVIDRLHCPDLEEEKLESPALRCHEEERTGATVRTIQLLVNIEEAEKLIEIELAAALMTIMLMSVGGEVEVLGMKSRAEVWRKEF